ncbi:MAG: DUF167 domain-containing protein [Verrucomicrobiales bacterium]|nr:DUF167 domain-containing protein [Verrucomicrobiales bacterium]
MKYIQVKVKPNARISALEGPTDEIWLARVKSSPVDGKANKELISLVSDHFNCSKSAVSIKSGKSSRIKLVQIDLK